MRSVGLKVLKNKLSEYVRLAANGETILITDRDRVVAEILPPRPARSPNVSDARLADMMRKGWLTPPARSGRSRPSHPSIKRLSTAEFLSDLDAYRADR